jgi:hypothetical protein
MAVVTHSITLSCFVRQLSVSFMTMCSLLFIFALRVHTLAVMWLFLSSFVSKENERQQDQDEEFHIP